MSLAEGAAELAASVCVAICSTALVGATNNPVGTASDAPLLTPLNLNTLAEEIRHAVTAALLGAPERRPWDEGVLGRSGHPPSPGGAGSGDRLGRRESRLGTRLPPRRRGLGPASRTANGCSGWWSIARTRSEA